MITLTEFEDKVEALVDQHGVGNIIEALATVCHAKADHIRTNWVPDDEGLAKSWERDGMRLDHLVSKLAN